jgi:predicted RNA-binding protein associated with RNAse of E/G family
VPTDRPEPAPLPRSDGSVPDRVLVTYLARSGVPRPVVVAGRSVLEAESPAVWFTFPGARHDIGRFHAPDGTFTGIYANILTPVELLPRGDDGADVWRTTDLFLDVFVTPDGDVYLLDRDELDEAVEAGWLDGAAARDAEAEAHRIVDAAGSGRWPPAIVGAWPLERARRVAESTAR